MEKNKSIQKCIKLIEENKITFADNILTQILIKNNNDFDALYLKGVILGMQERHHECTEYLKKAEKINPNNGFLQFNLAKALSKIGEEELAVKHHEYAVRLIPNYPEARINLAKSYYKLTNIEEALNVAEKIIQISPEYKHAYYFLSKLNE
jgi:tetratricopeptide (TPR) repeat protein